MNTLLLDKLADGAHGARDYVAPGEDIEVKVSALYQKVSKPALTDVKLSWEGLDAVEIFPRPVPDLFHGSELSLFGRFKAAGKGKLVVTGKSGSRSLRFEYPVEFPKEATRNLETSAFRAYPPAKRRTSPRQAESAAKVPLPLRQAKLSGRKRASKIGSMTLHRAWWTTRSRKRAAFTSRILGSRTVNSR